LLQGIPPYGEAYNMKFPGTYAMYALIMTLFGQTVRGIHLGLMVVNCASILFTFYLTKRVAGDFGAVIAGGTYAVLSLSSSVLGFAAHATHFVVLPAMVGALLLLNVSERNKVLGYFWPGGLFGLAFLMKQPGFFFILFGALYILCQPIPCESADRVKRRLFNLGAFTLGAAAPLVVTFAWLYAAGVFERFWFWTFQYASKYGSQIPLSGAFPILKSSLSGVAGGFFLLWCIGALGFLVVLLRGDFKGDRVFMILFTVFSFLTVCPGFYFRQHYFITFLPAVSVLVGICFEYLDKKGSVLLKGRYIRIIACGIFLIVVVFGVIDQNRYFFLDAPVRLSRAAYGANPFAESIEIAKFIAGRSSVTDRVAVLGSEPQIFFYAKRHSATGYIYTYGLMEIHGYSLRMQKEMIGEIEAALPKFVVVVAIATSWLVRANSERFIFGWIGNYLGRNYSLVGVADIISPDVTVYRWDDDARDYKVLSEARVLIYERK
ncbi:MAG TPA: glycosyltransferase family 39 protein, partial [Nitrososphaera sp.]|nr:glycosyltransferase family 39 protein [Nitrososphaera sp.]